MGNIHTQDWFAGFFFNQGALLFTKAFGRASINDNRTLRGRNIGGIDNITTILTAEIFGFAFQHSRIRGDLLRFKRVRKVIRLCWQYQ